MSKHSNQFLKNILNCSSVPFFVKDAKLKFVLINYAFTMMLGLKEEDILGKDDYDFFPPEKADFFKSIDEEVLKTGIENFNEEKLLTPDGLTMTLNTGKSRAEDDSGNYYIVGNIYDTTERNQLIDNLKIGNQMLERYAHLVSHDLKSPVSTIHRFSELLKRSLDSKLTEEETEYLNFITNSSGRLFNLVEKLLNFSNLNMQVLCLEQVNACKLLNDVKSDLSGLIEKEGSAIHFKNLPKELFAINIY